MRRWPIVLIALVVAVPALARLGLGGTSGPTIPDDVTLPVSSTPVGAVSANAFTGWTNPADTAANSTNWTSPSTSIRYLYPTDSKYPVATTVGQWRDVEVTTWMRRGCVLLRWSGTTAVYFIFSEDTDTFSAGVRTGINPGGTQTTDCPASSASTTLGSYTPSSIPGYSSTDTAAQTYTFGCAGWECYAKFNGVEFWRSEPDIRWPMEAGAVALSVPNTGYGFRDTSVDWLPLETIYSKPPASIYDMRDFGFYSVETTGSITSGSSDLTVASSAGYAIGDAIIVECGYEAGACARNTVGVGGTWPAAHYANDAAMDAAVPCTANSYAYLEDTGKVRRCASNGASWNAWEEALYYTAMRVPRALSASITNISGNTLTLDTAASATATNAKVYLDSTQHLDMFADLVGNSAFTPVGTYRFPENIVWQSTSGIHLNDNVTIQGAGFNKATPIYTLYTPDGAIGASLQIANADYIDVVDFFIRSNGGPEKYGLYWTANGVTASTYPAGITFSVVTGGSVTDSGAENTIATAVGFSYCTNCEMVRPYAAVTYAPTRYIGSWKINYSDSSGGTVTDAEVDSDWLINGFELFRSDGVQVHGFTGRNALVSSNSSGGGWLWEDFILDFDEDSADYPVYYGALDNFIMSVNSNIQPPNPSMLEGGTIRNPVVTLAYLTPADYLPPVIVVNTDNPNITIEGTYPSCSSPLGLIQTPGWHSGLNSFYGVGVRTSGDNTVVSGIRFDGDADYGSGKANIIAGEGVTTRTATITNNVMDHAATGTFIKTETGTITNSAYEALCP